MAPSTPVPQLLKEEVLFLRKRRLCIAQPTLERDETIALTDENERPWKGKFVPRGSLELAIWQLLASINIPYNRTIPVEFARLPESTLILYPRYSDAHQYLQQNLRYGNDPLLPVLDFAFEIIKGVQFMHDLGIPHGGIYRFDCSYDRVSYVGCAVRGPTQAHGVTAEGSLIEYRIENFAYSAKILRPYLPSVADRHFDTESLFRLIQARKSLVADDFGDDVCALGMVLWACMKASFRYDYLGIWKDLPKIKKWRKIPLSVRAFAKTLIHRKHSTFKPTIHQVARLFYVLLKWLQMTRCFYWILPEYHADFIDIYGWSMLVHLLLRGRSQGRIYVQKKYRELKRAFAPSQALTIRHHALIAYRGVAGRLMTLPAVAYWFGALLVYIGARRALLVG